MDVISAYASISISYSIISTEALSANRIFVSANYAVTLSCCTGGEETEIAYTQAMALLHRI